jgi:hypothetical protein
VVLGHHQQKCRIDSKIFHFNCILCRKGFCARLGICAQKLLFELRLESLENCFSLFECTLLHPIQIQGMVLSMSLEQESHCFRMEQHHISPKATMG